MRNLPTPTPALARKVWEAMPAASTRRVSRKLHQAGMFASHQTINRWRRQGWRQTEPTPHPLDVARAALDDAAPVLTGDPTSTASTLIEQHPERASLDQLSDGELLRKAARQLLIAIYVVSAAMLRREDLVAARTGAVAFLIRALGAALSAAATVLGLTMNGLNVKPQRR